MVQEPLLKGENSRAVFVETALHREIAACANSRDPSAYRIGQLVRDLDRFSSGKTITVGYGKHKTCFMKLLDPPAEEVWEIRSRDPKPAYRLFCRFALPDVLIVLTYGKRNDLGAEGSFAWKNAIRDCKAKWRLLFPPYLPHQGITAHDYIKHNVVVVGDIT